MDDRPRNHAPRRGRYLAQRKRGLPVHGEENTSNERFINEPARHHYDKGTSSSDTSDDSDTNMESTRPQKRRQQQERLEEEEEYAQRRSSKPTRTPRVLTASIPQPQPLPDDHPLVQEMDKLVKRRSSRRQYWFRRARYLRREWDQPNGPDRKRYEEEERVADQTSQDIAILMAFAQRGLELPTVTLRRDKALPGQGPSLGIARSVFDNSCANGESVEQAAASKVRDWIASQKAENVAGGAESMPLFIGSSRCEAASTSSDDQRLLKSLQRGVRQGEDGVPAEPESNGIARFRSEDGRGNPDNLRENAAASQMVPIELPEPLISLSNNPAGSTRNTESVIHGSNSKLPSKQELSSPTINHLEADRAPSIGYGSGAFPAGSQPVNGDALMQQLLFPVPRNGEPESRAQDDEPDLVPVKDESPI